MSDNRVFRTLKQTMWVLVCPLVAVLLSWSAGAAQQPETPGAAAAPKQDNLASAPASTTGSGAPAAPSSLFKLRPYKPLYIIAAYDRTLSNGDLAVQDWEMQFQLSFKVPFAALDWENAEFAFGYTQVSFWQLFNGNYSAPFRETNYAPEVMVSFDHKTTALGLKNIHTVYSIIHQSNGMGGASSRSWNRAYAEVKLEWEHVYMGLKPWYRIPEQRKNAPSDTRGDDNPDIHHYMGYGELSLGYQNKGWSMGVTVRNNLRGSQNLGSGQLDITFPIMHEAKFYIQAFEGYGLSLIDYNRRSTRIGCGVLLARWP